MMLYEELLSYVPTCEQEARDKALMLSLLQNGATPLTRENPVQHFTASAWIVSPDQRILMVYHNLYHSWSWTGGHADGEEDLYAVALREAMEETGISSLTPVCGRRIFSLEILPVSGHVRRGVYVASHLHCNVTYLFSADPTAALRVKPDENSGVRWIAEDVLSTACEEPWMTEWVYAKLLAKTKTVLAELQGKGGIA